MNKVLVEVYVLKMDKTYEIFLPPNKCVADIIVMLVNSINEITNGIFPKDYHVALFDSEAGGFFDPSLSLKKSNINNGKKLILF